MTAMLIYLIMAVDLPQWAIKAIDKIQGNAPSRAWRARHFRFEEHGMGTSNALAMAAQN
jgi:hypothetical protein